MSTRNKQTGRRNFLKQMAGLGVGGVFYAAARTALGYEPPADRAATPARRRSQGYRVTPHIQTYYDKAGS